MKAFVTFENTSAYKIAIEKFFWCKKKKDRPLVNHEYGLVNYIYFIKTVDPSQINWDNWMERGGKMATKCRRFMFMIVVTFFYFIVCVPIIGGFAVLMKI